MRPNNKCKNIYLALSIHLPPPKYLYIAKYLKSRKVGFSFSNSVTIEIKVIKELYVQLKRKYSKKKKKENTLPKSLPKFLLYLILRMKPVGEDYPNKNEF